MSSRLLYPVLDRFLPYYGGKKRIAGVYPTPKHDTIIEPFAGGAGYSLHYPAKNVQLYDADPIVCGVWDYLIRSSDDEIRRLPLEFESTEELSICQEAKWLIGFWLQPASATGPYTKRSTWSKSRPNATDYWSDACRFRLANQQQYIKHWTITNCCYSQIPEQRGTWFIDPPYQGHDGSLYRHKIDNYLKLGMWCRQRTGQVIVCDQQGATYLPFRELGISHQGAQKSTCHEVIWYNEK